MWNTIELFAGASTFPYKLVTQSSWSLSDVAWKSSRWGGETVYQDLESCCLRISDTNKYFSGYRFASPTCFDLDHSCQGLSEMFSTWYLSLADALFESHFIKSIRSQLLSARPLIINRHVVKSDPCILIHFLHVIGMYCFTVLRQGCQNTSALHVLPAYVLLNNYTFNKSSFYKCNNTSLFETL